MKTKILLFLFLALSFSLAIADSLSTPLPDYQARFGRKQALIAVVADNEMTELTDFVVPYAVLKASGATQVLSVATGSGVVNLYPALKMQAETTMAGFDQAYPQGADYVIVPAVHNVQAAVLQSWVRAQAAKGAIIVGICDGVWVLAHAGLLEQRRAVGFWYSMDGLQKQFPNTTWVRNQRYLADGKIITTTGVTASLPASLALVASIAGHERATALASELGIKNYLSTHDSQQFKMSFAHAMTIAGNWLRFWSHEEIALPLSAGVNDIALALYADAWSRTYRSQVKTYAASMHAVQSRYGLQLLPDAVADADVFDQMKREQNWLTDISPARAIDKALQEIGKAYGLASRAMVSTFMEYPQ
ncbi:DJ-1/PfpI family protein [Undibacterium sp. JH2W]|uniref:AraC family transcriptional regulator n=1 Tax=Undibacterium sp. JH2W TaxID=3413037 RepID=UPI003BF131C4